MTKPTRPYDLAAVRKLLLAALNGQELRELLYFAENADLHPVVRELEALFSPTATP